MAEKGNSVRVVGSSFGTKTSVSSAGLAGIQLTINVEDLFDAGTNVWVEVCQNTGQNVKIYEPLYSSSTFFSGHFLGDY